MISLRRWLYQAMRIIFTPTSFFKDLKEKEEDEDIPLQFARTSGVIETALFLIVCAGGYIFTASSYPHPILITALSIFVGISAFIKLLGPLGLSRKNFYSDFGDKDKKNALLLYSSAFTSLTSWIPLIPLFYMLNNPLGPAKEGFISGSSILTSLYLTTLVILFLLSSILGMSIPGFVLGLVPLTTITMVYQPSMYLNLPLIAVLSLSIFLYQFYIQYVGFTTLIDVEKSKVIKSLLKTVALFGIIFLILGL